MPHNVNSPVDGPRVTDRLRGLDCAAVRGVVSTLASIEPDAGLVVAVSGGADSVALSEACVRAWRKRTTRLMLAHLDHGLRPDSAADAVWVRDFAAALKLPLVTEQRAVSEVVLADKLGIEEAARQCRYEFLSRVAAEHDCRYVAVGHTADDQAETVLHHLLRGTGLAGLRGMPARRSLDRATLIRPFLSVSRSDVESFLAQIGQTFLTDASNEDAAHTRNRIRHLLLPLLRDQFNPQVAAALSRLALQADDCQQVVEQQAAELVARAIEVQTPGRVVLKTAPLAAASKHLVREAFRQMFISQGWPRQRMSFASWDRLAALVVSTQIPRRLSLPQGVTACSGRGCVTLSVSGLPLPGDPLATDGSSVP